LRLAHLRVFSPPLRSLQLVARLQVDVFTFGRWSNRRAQCTRILHAVVIVGAARGRARAAAGVKLFGMSVKRTRTRRPCGQGGSSARAAAPECCGAHSWWYGHIDPSAGRCEVARGPSRKCGWCDVMDFGRDGTDAWNGGTTLGSALLRPRESISPFLSRCSAAEIGGSRSMAWSSKCGPKDH